MIRILNRKSIIWLVSILVFIAIFVCLLFNFADSSSISWLVYPVSSLVIGWLILIPTLHLKSAGIKYSLGALTAVILPYLLILNKWTQGNWFLPVAVPIVLASLAYLWIVFFLWKLIKNKWYFTAAVLFLSGCLTLAVWMVLQTPFAWGWLVFGITTAASLMLLVTRLFLKK